MSESRAVYTLFSVSSTLKGVKILNIDTVFIIGGQRCGTTFLTELLRRRPGTLVLNNQGEPEPRTIMAEDYPNTISEYIHRLKYKSQIRKSNLVIEKSTSYYESLLALSRFEYGFKDSKFIMILRDPLERAISNYFFSKKNGLETRAIGDAFCEPLLCQPVGLSVNPFDYIGRSQYHRHLAPWRNSNLKGNLLFILYDQLIDKPELILSTIFQFLGREKATNYIDTDILSQPINASSKPFGYEEAIRKIPDSALKKLVRERKKMELLFDND